MHCFDPTSLAKNFMEREKYDKNLIHFQPYGIWNTDGKIKFYYQDEANRNNSGGSTYQNYYLKQIIMIF